MKNHKLVFQKYGVRRPLKWRRRRARAERRLLSSINKEYQIERGSHSRWMEEGRVELWILDTKTIPTVLTSGPIGTATLTVLYVSEDD